MAEELITDAISKIVNAGRSAKICCAVFLSFFVVCCGAPTIKTGPAATLDPKVALHESISQVLGTDHSKNPRLTKISYSDPEAGDITITWAINDDLPQHSQKIDAQMDATNILKALKNNKTRFIYVILIGTVSMQDRHGNMAEIQALSLGFNKSKLDQIHWEDFQPSDIYDLADVADIADEWK